MSTYYVSATGGSNANAGTSPSSPWATLAKAFATGSTVVAGDTVRLAPGSYPETVVFAVSGSAGSVISILGDPSASLAWPSGVVAGPIVWTAYTTNNTTTPATATTCYLGAHNYLTFEDLVIVGGNSSDPSAFGNNGSTCRGITLRRCVITPGYDGAGRTLRFDSFAANGTPMDLLIEQCVLVGTPQGGGFVLMLYIAAGGGADWNANVTIRNSLFLGQYTGRALFLDGTGSGGMPGGIKFLGNTCWGFNVGVRAESHYSTTIPGVIEGCIFTGENGIYSGTAGQLTEDKNVIWCSTPRTSVTAGTNSKVSPTVALLFEYGQSWLQGFWGRPFLQPMPASPFLGFGTPAASDALDFMNRPRPAGGASTTYAAGYLERHDAAAPKTGAGADGGSGGYIQQTGPADDDFEIPVDAVSTTISVKVDWDSNHGDTNKPQAILLDAPEIGVTTQTVTSTGTAAGGYDTLTFSAFTPSAKGVVVVRLRSRSAAGNGLCNWDSVSVS